VQGLEAGVCKSKDHEKQRSLKEQLKYKGNATTYEEKSLYPRDVDGCSSLVKSMNAVPDALL